MEEESDSGKESSLISSGSARRFSPGDQRKNKEDQENNEKNFSDPGSQSGNDPKPQDSCNDRDHQEEESP